MRHYWLLLQILDIYPLFRKNQQKNLNNNCNEIIFERGKRNRDEKKELTKKIFTLINTGSNKMSVKCWQIGLCH